MYTSHINKDSFILFGSGNKGKYSECKAILRDIPLISLELCNIEANAEERGSTFFENAFSKALHYYKALQNVQNKRIKAVLVEDSGICVHALGNKPGIHSARYGAAKDSTSSQKQHEHSQCICLQKEMQGMTERGAHFTCCAVLLQSPDEFISVQTTWHGSIITTEPIGKCGFGYDPIFFVDSRGCTSAELEESEKNALSHRGKALRALLPHIKVILET